jgi:hypothetical protein
VLIVNADDYGASVSATDSVIDAFEEGLISSASAMVWMWDSARAAELARERGLPLGLHLNLTLAFRDGSAPAAERELQAELAGEFDAGSWLQADVRPREGDRRIREAVVQQLAAFRALYGEPSHLDGHHHIHIHPAVTACLPRELPIRPVLHSPTELGRRGDARDRLLRKQFRCADGCVGFQHVHPAFEDSCGLGTLDFARRHVLEVMVHPQLEEERAALRTREWIGALAALQLGSYRGLQAR